MRKTIGHYEIVAELGRGGMGVVYKGFEPALNRHVAIKTLADHLAADPGVVERFMREARSMASLSDAHIVPIYLVGEDKGLPYFAMEFVEGESVADRLKREGRLAAVEARRIVLQAAQGLAVAHEQGVIHRDIKPANLLIAKRGVIKVADFGIALAASDMHQKLTGTGQLVGTPGYLSPEVCLGKPTDARSDIFSLGVVLFEMLTGRMPFLDESPLGLMLSVVQSNMPDVRELAADVDEYSVQILEGMVAKDPEARYQNCEALIEALLAAGTPYHPSLAGVTPVPGRSTAATRLDTPLPQGPVPAGPPAPPPVVSAGPVSASTRLATPAPVNQSAPAIPAQPPSPPVRRRSMALPIAIAAVLFVALASAAGFLWMRGSDQVQNLLAVVTGEVSDASGSDGPPDSNLASTASTADSGTTVPVDVRPAPTDPVAVDPDGSASIGESVGDGRQSIAQSSIDNDPGSSVRLADTPTQAELAPAEVPAPVATQGAATADASPLAAAQPSPPASSAPPGRLGERLGAAVREQQAALRTARIESSPERAAAPSRPPPAALPSRTLVIAIGDPAVTGPAQMAIEDALADAGVALADLDTVPGLARLADGDGDMADLLAAVARAGIARTVVTLRAIPVGQQELTYYGEVSTLYTAQLRLRAFDVGQRQPIGRLAQTQVNFTNLNADYNTRQALAPLLDRVVDGVRQR
jgi:serine/threonine-protein kinase